MKNVGIQKIYNNTWYFSASLAASQQNPWIPLLDRRNLRSRWVSNVTQKNAKEFTWKVHVDLRWYHMNEWMDGWMKECIALHCILVRCLYACMNVGMYVCMCVCMYECMNVWMYECMNVCMYVCIHVSMYLCIHVSMYLCMHVCM